MSPFAHELQKTWKDFSTWIMGQLHGDEQLNISLEAEDSLFLRFNHARIRQNTQVEQNYTELTLQSQRKTAKRKITLTSNFEENCRRSEAALRDLRTELTQLAEDPFQLPMENRGQSFKAFPGKTPAVEQIVRDLEKTANDLDLVGFFAGGPRISANANSAGQNHWFSNEKFFFDYSIYKGDRAVSSNFSGDEWSSALMSKDLDRNVAMLKHLEKPIRTLKPGKYRTYLAPIAIGDITNLFNWQGFGMGDYKRGRSSMRKVVDGEVQFSPKFSLRNNFESGLSPSFNSLGEVAPTILPLVEHGKFMQLFTSSRSAKEFGVPSTYAPPEEAGSSLEVGAGTLSEVDILKELGTGLYLSHVHYLNYSDLNTARITGMTRFAALWVENGEIQGPIQNMRFDHSLFDLFGKDLIALTKERRTIPDLLTYNQRNLGGVTVPGALLQELNFTL